MPIVRDASGHARYVSSSELFYRERPSDFLPPFIIEQRLQEAHHRVIEAIRFATVPLSGRGTCCEVRGLGRDQEKLVNFVDEHDSRRIKLLRKQRKREVKSGLLGKEQRMRSPQVIARRRSALFSGADIPVDYFRSHYQTHLSKDEQEKFVDLMRWYLLQEAIARMVEHHELENVSEVWSLKVSTLDLHKKSRRPQRVSTSVKHDYRPFHGRPNRDRGKVAA